jgi:protein gp37
MADCTRCHDHLDVHFHEERLEQPLRWKKPRRIFLGSMTDLWDPNVKPEWRRQIWAVCAFTPRHEYIVLTKQPQSINWDELGRQWPAKNMIIGTSVSGAEDGWRALALGIGMARSQWERPPPVCRYEGGLAVSFEPLLADVGDVCLDKIDWVIIGAASGQVARIYPPTRETLAPVIDSILTLAGVLEIPVFIKENAEAYLPKWIDARTLQKRYRKCPT